MSQTIFRVQKKTQNFTIISNVPINDKSLSPGALGILIYLLSKPDNWIVFNREVQARFSIGRKQLDGILTELKQAGYIERKRFHDGLKIQWETHVYELPKEQLSHFGTIGAIVPLGADTLGADTLGADTLGADTLGADILKTDSLKTDSPRTKEVSIERGNAHASRSSALSIFLSVTKIKDVNKIPEKVTEWLGEQEQYMQSDGHPEALRKAIIKADAEGDLFNINVLDYLFSDYLYPDDGNGKTCWYTDEEGKLIRR